MKQKAIHVAAGAVADANGRILLTRRPDHVHQGGLWEFPGGKLEPGEGPRRGLARELHEELGIRVLASEPLIRVHHDYGDRQVLLEVRRVSRFSGQPHGREGQPLRWMHPRDMDPGEFPAADRPIIYALRLPDRMLITGPDARDPAGFLDRLARALSAGVRLVQLRAPGLDEPSFRSLSARVEAQCRASGAFLVLNPPDARARWAANNGLHLSSRLLWASQRRPRPAHLLVGASCHTGEDLRRAADLGLDYALLSPVRPTASHPQVEPLGWKRFARLVDPVPLPVYALGGLGPEDLPVARRHGAQGIAAIRALW
jgi:8-oxo-dGTP diphosphatase